MAKRAPTDEDKIDQLIDTMNAYLRAKADDDGDTSLRDDVRSIKQDLQNTVLPAVKKINDDYFVKKSEFVEFKNKQFDPVDNRTRDVPTIKMIVYGMVGLVVIAVFTALIALVVLKPGVTQ